MPKGVIAPPRSEATRPAPGAKPSWIKQHKGAAIGIGLVGVAAIYLIIKKKSSSSSSTTNPAGSVGTSTGPAVYEIAPGTTGSASNDYSGQLMGIEQAINSLQTSQAASSSATSSPSGVTSSSGSANSGSAGAASSPTQFYVGEQVAPGEVITGQSNGIFVTNKGGVYNEPTGEPYGGSYLGYLSSLKTTNPTQYAQESANPMTFNKGQITSLGNNQYSITSDQGATYKF